MQPYGSGGRGVLFVGEAPGADEDEQGRPFVGKAGQRLRGVLKSLHFDIDNDAWVTNALICRPPKNRTPNANEIEYCRPNLVRTIRTLRPSVIILLGQTAISSVLGMFWKEDVGAAGRWVGWRIPHQQLGAWVCPTWHPSYIMREGDPVLDQQFSDHIAAACAITGPPEKCTLAGVLKKEHDPEKAAAWLHDIATTPTGAVAFDYETNMLKPDAPNARIISCAVAWGRKVPERAIAFPWTGAAINAMGALLRTPIPKIASNLKFEDRWTRKVFGHRVRSWAWDTMLAAHVADNRQAITSVKFQAFVRLGVLVWNDRLEQYMQPAGGGQENTLAQNVSTDDLLHYNGLDAIYEFAVAVDQMHELNYPIHWII